MLGRFAEGEHHCRKALEVDCMRPSAYRNLGVSLHGNGNVVAAAWALVEAAKADPSDDRARGILQNLLSMNPELVVTNPWIIDGLDPSPAKPSETALV
jgi:Flp pilus assembly protein TadD